LRVSRSSLAPPLAPSAAPSRPGTHGPRASLPFPKKIRNTRPPSKAAAATTETSRRRQDPFLPRTTALPFPGWTVSRSGGRALKPRRAGGVAFRGPRGEGSREEGFLRSCHDSTTWPCSRFQPESGCATALPRSRECPERQQPLIGQSVVVSPHGRSPERRPVELRPAADSRLL